MDEADVLGDRVAIIKDGEIRASGDDTLDFTFEKNSAFFYANTE